MSALEAGGAARTRACACLGLLPHAAGAAAPTLCVRRPDGTLVADTLESVPEWEIVVQSNVQGLGAPPR